ncbi:MAG: hypothetical protein NVS4B11_30840 [Ktedonobacteraceae bacterium]
MPNSKSNDAAYPAVNFRETIMKAKMIFEERGTKPIDKHAVARAMKYGLNGYSYGVISALIQYGLLENVDRLLKVSDDASKIISSKTEPSERIKAIKKLAFNPPIFSELHKSYPDNLPDNDSLELHLINKGLNPRVVDSFIRSYRSTVEFIEEETEEPDTEIEVSMQTQPNTNHNSNWKDDAITATQGNELLDQMVSLKYPNCNFRLMYNSDISNKVIDQIIAHLNLLRESQ